MDASHWAEKPAPTVASLETVEFGPVVSLGGRSANFQSVNVAVVHVEDVDEEVHGHVLSEHARTPSKIESLSSPGRPRGAPMGHGESPNVISQLLESLSSLQQGHLKFGQDLQQCERDAGRVAEALQRSHRFAEPEDRLATGQSGGAGHSPGSVCSTTTSSGHGEGKKPPAVVASRSLQPPDNKSFLAVLPCTVADDPNAASLGGSCCPSCKAKQNVLLQPDAPPSPLFKTQDVTPRSSQNGTASALVETSTSRPSMQLLRRAKQRPLLPHAAFSSFSIEDMKAQVREATTGKTYNTVEHYKQDSVFAKIAMNEWFDNITLVVIALNSIWLAIETDQNDEVLLKESGALVQVMEHFFCTFFLVEWLVRFFAYDSKRDCWQDTSFLFDGFLVVLAITETWILLLFSYVSGFGGGASALRLVRLARLTRMARISRVVRAMPELMILIKGILVATRSVFFTLLLLVILIYVFAIAFTQLAKDEDTIRTLYFSSVGESMITLMAAGAMPDLAEQLDIIRGESTLAALAFLLFVLLSSFTLMNMLIGVLVEVVTEVSRVEKARLDFVFVMDKLSGMVNSDAFDQNGDNRISRAEFAMMITTPMCARTLKDVGVDVVGLVDCVDFIFEDGDDMSFVKFMEVIMQLRGSNTATVRDVVDMKKVLKSEICRLSEDMEARWDKMAQRLGIPKEAPRMVATCWDLDN